MKATIEGAEIRGCERKTNKKGEPYLLVHFEDATGQANELVDKDMSREPYYVRGTQGTIYIDIVQTKWTTIRIIDFKQKGATV